MKIPIDTEYHSKSLNNPKVNELVASLPIGEFESFNGSEMYKIDRPYIEINTMDELKEFMLKCPCDIRFDKILDSRECLSMTITNSERLF